MKLCGIYSIKNILNNKYYVGSSIDIHNRWASHKSDLKLNKHHSIYLQRAYNKYGKENFEFTILEITLPTNKILTVREQYWIDNYKSSNYVYGYNLYPKARTCLGYKHSEETKEKRRGIKFSAKHLENLRLSHLGQKSINKGKKLSPDHVAKLRKAWIQRKINHPTTDATRLKHSKHMMGNQFQKGKIPWNKGLKLK